MSRKTLPVLLALLLLGAGSLIAGCVSTHTGRAEPAPAVVPPATSTGAPRIPRQLDATRLVNSPCDALTATELIGLDPGFANSTTTNVTDQFGAGCGWSSPDLSQTINISFEISAPDGLGQVYQEHDSMAYWQPMVIKGYPAVAASLYDARPDGTCVVNAGISDHLFFFVKFLTLNSNQKAQSCSLAAQGAGDVIDNLGGGS